MSEGPAGIGLPEARIVEPMAAPTDAPVRLRRRRTRINPRKRGIVTGAVVLVVLVVLAVAWVGLRGLFANTALNKARTAVLASETDYRQGLTNEGSLQASVAKTQADRARKLTGDSIWHLASHLPVVGSTLHTASGLALAADDIAGRVLPIAATAASQADGRTLRTPAGGVNLTALASVNTELAGAQAQLAQTQLSVAALPAHTLVGAVGEARTSLLTTITTIQHQVSQIVTGSQLAVSMLGADGPRRYLLALQNPAEVRGTGGLIGTYAIVEATDGKVSLLQTGSDQDLKEADKPSFDLGADYDAQWRTFTPYTDWRQSNFSPNFPDAATIWLSLWERQTGQHLDGAVAIDPEIAGAMLSATNATATLPDGTRLTGKQVANYTESTLYAKYATDNEGRKKALVALTTAVFDQLKAGADARGVLSALATGAGEGRVLVASAHPEEQQQLLATVVGGTLSPAPGPYQHVVVNNTGGSKVDYYLDRSVSYDLGACSGATRTSTITVTLQNGAPASGLTPYVAGNLDGTPGLSALYVTVYAAVGAHLQSATLNGVKTGPLQFAENGRPSFGTYALIKPGATATLVLHLVEPSGGQPVTQMEQPLHRLGDIRVNTPSCGASHG